MFKEILEKIGLFFEPIAHKYYIKSKIPTAIKDREIPSATDIINKILGNPFVKDTLYMRQARDKGTLIHKAISDYVMTGKEPDFTMIEFDNFVKLTNEHKLVWTLSEQIIYNNIDDMEYAGTLDLFALLQEEITDIKTGSTKALKKWQIQLSLYAQALRDIFGLKVSKGSVFWLHDEASEYIPIKLLTKAEIKEILVKYYKEDDDIEEQNVTLQCLNANAIQELNETLTAIEVMEEKVKSIKAKIKEEMEARNISQIKLGKRVISYVAPVERETIDSKKLKSEYPEAWQMCKKVSKVASSIRIK